MVKAFQFTGASQLEPGDRLELVLSEVTRAGGRFTLPAGFLKPGETLTLLSEDGLELEAKLDLSSEAIVIPEWRRFFADGTATVWLECCDAGRFRVVAEELPPETVVSAVTTEQGLEVRLNPQDREVLRTAVGLSSSLEGFQIALEAASLSTHAGFDRLICLPHLRDMEILEHQVRTAKSVLRRLRGRALLCDEVGLGKTIEAGIVLSELCMRGLARTVLILVPPSLIEQWQGEMRRKFSLELVSQDDPVFREHGTAAWNKVDRVIASMHTAKREPHRCAILARKWDLVIIDEAHHLRNRSTQLWRFASALEKKFILLLTATPVQNNLDELFNLVTLLEPGLLSTARKFQKTFVDRRDKLVPLRVDELHALLGEVMVRNRRSSVGLQFTRRWARTDAVQPTAGERKLYDSVAEFVRGRLHETSGKGSLTRMALLSLQKALGSSSRAAASTLRKISDDASLDPPEREALAAFATDALGLTESSKAIRLLQILDEFKDKMVVFTQFRATQEMLDGILGEAGHEVALFHGGLSRMEKEAAVNRFRGPAKVLLATESGSEGRNLQFAHAVCNFDLPWNPMRIEQRIGRLSRIGQTRDVHVFNLVAAGTVEAAILHLLSAKLNMFELVIGEIDMVLGNLEDDRDFEEVIADLWAGSAGSDDFSARMEDLGNRLLAAKEAYLAQRSHDDRLFADRFVPEG